MSVPECTLARLFKIAHFMVHIQLDMPPRLTAHFGKCEPHAPRGDLSLGVPVLSACRCRHPRFKKRNVGHRQLVVPSA
jgi:hypothetical protein